MRTRILPLWLSLTFTLNTLAASVRGTFVRHEVREATILAVLTNSSATLPLDNSMAGGNITNNPGNAFISFAGSLSIVAPAQTPTAVKMGNRYVFDSPLSITVTFNSRWDLQYDLGDFSTISGGYINSGIGRADLGQYTNDVEYAPVSAGTTQHGLTLTINFTEMFIEQTGSSEAVNTTGISSSVRGRMATAGAPPAFIYFLASQIRSIYTFAEATGMEVLPTRLDFDVPSDGRSQPLIVRNTGSSNLNFTVSTASANWLIALPEGGTLGPQQTTNLTVFLDDDLVPQNATNAATITVSGNAANSPRVVNVYAVRGSNHLAVLDRTPTGAILTTGEEAAFSTEVRYQLATAASGELVLDVLDSRAQLIASTGPRTISRLNAPALMTLAMSPITVQRAWTNVTLRIQLIANGTVLTEAKLNQPYQVLDPSEQFLQVLLVKEDAEVQLPGGDWMEAQIGTELREGTQISTGPDAELHLLFPDGSVMIVKQMTEVLVNTLLRQGNALKAQVLLKIGEVSAQVNPLKVVTSDFSVATPVATASVRGTVFTVRHVAQPEPASTVIVSNGIVEFVPKNPALPPLLVGSNQTAQVTAASVTSPSAPVITQLGAASGVAGAQLTISGANFSATAASNIVSFGGFHASVVNASANQLTVVIPDSLATAIEPITVTVNGFTSNPTNLLVTASRAATIVSGDVTGIWTRALSPYSIAGDAVVPAGSTLQIEPGVVVTMQNVGSHLFVPGTLIAEGTNGAPIRFTSVNTNKAPAQWGAVVIQDSSDDAQTRLANCTLEYGGYFQQGTLELHSASPRLEGITVRSSSVNGLYLTNSSVRMTNCVFSENVNAAVLMDVASFPYLRGTFATRNGFDGIAVLPGAFVRSGTWINDGRLLYRIYGAVEVTSTNTLILQPGTTVELADSGSGLFVNGTLQAIGSPGELITFTADGTNTARGQWGAIVIGSSATNTVLEHCIVERGGYFRAGNLEINGASPTIRNCAIGSSSWHGLWISGASTARVTDCSFVNNAQAAIGMMPDCFPIVGHNSASSNGANAIAIQGGVVPASGTWLRDTIPYALQTDVTVASNAVLTIAPGTTVQIADINGDLVVDGALVARGTTSQPILFTTDDVPPAPGRWAAIVIRDSSDDMLTALEHCIVEYGGYFRAGSVEIINASPLLANTTVRRSSFHGISLAGSAARISACHFGSNTVYAALMDLDTFPLVTNNTASGNAGNAIAVSGGTLTNSGVWQRGGLPYTLVTDVTIAAGRTLVIEPGNTIQFADIGGELFVDGALDARGTVVRPIHFTSDDAIKAPGQWAGIILRNGTTPSLFQHCTLEAGGYFRNGSMELLSASPVISDSLFQNSSADGLFAQNSSSAVERSRFINNARDGIRIESTAGFRVHHSVLASNSAWGLRNLSPQIVPAQSNYWGHPSGPFDNANFDGLGLLNAGGTGDEASEYVQWSGFLTSAPAFATGGELVLVIERNAGGDVILSWDSAFSDADLERRDTLGGTNEWVSVGLTPTNSGGRAWIVLPPSAVSRFFRLRR